MLSTYPAPLTRGKSGGRTGRNGQRCRSDTDKWFRSVMTLSRVCVAAGHWR